jgi:hypothetical protein
MPCRQKLLLWLKYVFDRPSKTLNQASPRTTLRCGPLRGRHTQCASGCVTMKAAPEMAWVRTDGRRISDDPALLQKGKTDIALCHADLDAGSATETARAIERGHRRFTGHGLRLEHRRATVLSAFRFPARWRLSHRRRRCAAGSAIQRRQCDLGTMSYFSAAAAVLHDAY